MSIRLTPVEAEFIERISDEVTSSNALPFDLPTEQVVKIIERAAKWFYKWDEDSTQMQWLLIPGEEIAKARDYQQNAPIQLPDAVVGIMKVYQTESYGFAGGLTAFARDALFASLGTGVVNSLSDATRTSDYGMSDYMISAYEYSYTKQMTTRGLTHSFNMYTKTFNVMGLNRGNSIVLHCFVKIPPEALFANEAFERYCIALCMERIGKIVTTFDFKLPGGATINYEQIKADGVQARQEIEQEIKDQISAGIIITR